MIDYIRLSDMADSVCDMAPIKWEELLHLPTDRADITGTPMDKAVWIQTMVSCKLCVLVHLGVCCVHMYSIP